jgi:uncharacterized repeat protein (TIGR03809 family)
MAQRTAIVFSGPFAVRGLALAEQRLAYLTELYDTGRWRRFHDEPDFIFNIREAKAAVESWRRLVVPEQDVETPDSGGAEHSPIESVDDLHTEDLHTEDLHAEDLRAKPMHLADHGAAGVDAGAASETGAPGLAPLEPHRWRQRSGALLPPVGFSADGVGPEADLRKAG